MRVIPAAALGLGLLAAPQAAFSAVVMVVDRGLPTANLNNAAGGSRSNVAWDEAGASFDGDSFTLPGGPGAVYSIKTIRTWVVAGGSGFPANNDTNLTNDGFALGDFFSSTTLYTGIGATLSATASANITAGTNTTDSANVTITRVQYNGGAGAERDYQALSGTYRSMFEVVFSGLNIVATGGTTISFGVDGDMDGAWFNHASNAGLSGSPQDSADGFITCYSVSGVTATSCGSFDTDEPGIWDKVSDINVQVLAEVPEPATLALMGMSVLGLSLVRRRR